jgi:hypothetical protein
VNYLELVQELVEELGIGGADSGSGTPESVLNQVGPLGRAVRWIAQGNNHINLMWRDWKFLSTDYSETLVIGSRNWPAHSGSETIRQWDRTSIWLDKNTNDAKELRWMDWTAFRRRHDPGSHTINSSPAFYSIKPDNSIILDNPPDKAYAATAEFWKRVILLQSNNDTPDMPEEYHRLIVVTAGMMYGNKEGASEVISGMGSEYNVLLQELQSDQAPGFGPDTMSAEDFPLEVMIPGEWDGIDSAF